MVRQVSFINQALDKKRKIDEAIVEVKRIAEIESNKLKEVSVLREEAEKKLSSYKLELSQLTKNAENDLSQIFMLYKNSIEHLEKFGSVIETYINVLKQIDSLIDKKIIEVREAEVKRSNYLNEIGSKDRELEAKRQDINIYEERLLKKIKEAGLSDKIKPIFI